MLKTKQKNSSGVIVFQQEAPYCSMDWAFKFAPPESWVNDMNGIRYFVSRDLKRCSIFQQNLWITILIRCEGRNFVLALLHI